MASMVACWLTLKSAATPCKEGDYLEPQIEEGRYLDLEATEELRKRIQAKLDRLRRGEHFDHEDDEV